MTTLTKKDFALYIGVSQAYISKLIRVDRLVMKNKLVEVELSLERIKATQDPSKSSKLSHTAPNAENAEKPHQAQPKSEIDGERGMENVGGEFKLWQARKMKADAEMAEMEKAKMARELVPRDAAEFAMDDLAAGVRARMENLPARWAPVLAPMADLNQIQASLTELVENELRALSNQQSKRAKELAGEFA